MDDDETGRLFTSDDMIVGGKKGQRLRKLSRLMSVRELRDVLGSGDDGFGFGSSALSLGKGGDPIIVPAALVDELIGGSIDSNTYEDGFLLPLLGRGVFLPPGLGQVAGGGNTNMCRRVRRALDFCAPLDRRSCDVGRVLGVAAPVLANGIVGHDTASVLLGGTDQRDWRCGNLNISGSLDMNVSGARQVLKRAPEGDIGYLDQRLFAGNVLPFSEDNNDFNEGDNVVDDALWSDGSEFSDYELYGCSDVLGEYGALFPDDDDGDVDMVSFTSVRRTTRRVRVIPEGYASLGAPSVLCKYCGARMWKEERVNKSVTKGVPIFSLCCMKGAVRLPVVPPTPAYLMDLYDDKIRGPVFHRLIRLYNAMFAFTSSGGNVDRSVNNGRAPYVYRLNGQNHHVFGSLIPDDDGTPKFCQLYVYDTVNEVENRLHWVTSEDREAVDAAVVQGLITMLDDTNELVSEFRKQRDRYEGDEIVDLEITLKVIRSKKSADSSSKVRGFLSLKDYYSYSFQVRQWDGLTPRLGGRLFQQYLVDAFSTIEQTRLWWFRTHQTTIRNELYSHICDSVRRGDVDASNTGKGVILPAGVVGSKRYMQQNFQDALAVCRHVGHPDIFLTMTSNPFWDEIQKMMVFVPGCITANCPDIVSRLFRLKLEQLMTDIKSKAYFGVCNGCI
ncbi:hypothetical protein AgCh_022185 [Apium graveolens]